VRVRPRYVNDCSVLVTAPLTIDAPRDLVLSLDYYDRGEHDHGAVTSWSFVDVLGFLARMEVVYGPSHSPPSSHSVTVRFSSSVGLAWL
jgi:hypothetical protein